MKVKLKVWVPCISGMCISAGSMLIRSPLPWSSILLQHRIFLILKPPQLPFLHQVMAHFASMCLKTAMKPQGASPQTLHQHATHFLFPNFLTPHASRFP